MGLGTIPSKQLDFLPEDTTKHDSLSANKRSRFYDGIKTGLVHTSINLISAATAYVGANAVYHATSDPTSTWAQNPLETIAAATITGILAIGSQGLHKIITDLSTQERTHKDAIIEQKHAYHQALEKGGRGLIRDLEIKHPYLEEYAQRNLYE